MSGRLDTLRTCRDALMAARQWLPFSPGSVLPGSEVLDQVDAAILDADAELATGLVYDGSGDNG